MEAHLWVAAKNYLNNFYLSWVEIIEIVLSSNPQMNNRNTRKRCEISSKLTIITPERRH